MCHNELSDKFKGSMFGVAVGDALGATLEFMPRQEIQEKYGTLKDIIGGGYWQLKPGEVTDDTDMTIALARGILSNPIEPIECIAEEFVKWMKTEPKDVGNVCRLSLLEGIKHGARTEEEWLKMAKIGHGKNKGRSGGNGSLMRTIPVVLAYWNDKQKMINIAERQSHITHYDSIAASCTKYYCEVVREVLVAGKLKPVLEDHIKYSPVEVDLTGNLLNMETSGYVVHTLAVSLACVYQSTSFEDAVVTAVNLGGDADTIGAVTGGLAGAYYGYSSIPDRFKDKIVFKEQLLYLTKSIEKYNLTNSNNRGGK